MTESMSNMVLRDASASKKTRVKKRGQKYDVGDRDDVEEPPFESIRGMMTI